MAPPSGTTTSQQRISFEQSGATTISRITVQEDRDVTSRQYLRPPPSDIREGSLVLRVRQDIPRSRLSTTARNLENREDLDDEFVPSNKGFTRVSQQPHVHVTPPRRRKIVPPRDWSSSSDDYSPPPLSSSRLRADFRDLSPGTEAESRGRHTKNRTRRSRVEETRRNHQVSRRGSSRESPLEYRDNSLHVIKTLKGWGLRYSGEEKELPEQFLSRLKACKRATGILDVQLLPCLASIFVRDAGDWYEVYQDDILS